jgi:hypothetical protein|tara:strand:- start:76 stop:216 length:141 start_codon:yes stop_codon:yes gene_type:complete
MGYEGVAFVPLIRKNEMDIIPLEITIQNQLRVYALQVSVYITATLI